MDESMFAAQQIRKKLWWMLPVGIGMVAISWHATLGQLLPSVDELIQRAPSVRISPGGLLAPFFGVACVIATVLCLLRAIPYRGSWLKPLEWLMNGFISVAGVVLVLILLGSTLVQNQYMPQLGYTQCDLLQGGASMWSKTWIKNPDWCVQGKTREWVNEQAKLTSKLP